VKQNKQRTSGERKRETISRAIGLRYLGGCQVEKGGRKSGIVSEGHSLRKIGKTFARRRARTCKPAHERTVTGDYPGKSLEGRGTPDLPSNRP